MDDLPLHEPLTYRRARALGVRRREHGTLWRSPNRDVHQWAGLEPDDPWTRAAAAAALLPARGALGGWAAAYALGALDLDGLGRDGTAPEPVPLVVPPPAQVRRRPGLLLVRSALPPADVVLRRGVRVTGPVRTAFDLARGLPGPHDPDEALAALDAVLAATGVLPEQVRAYAQERRGARGAPRARRLASLADPRTRSRGETRLRLLWLGAGLPPPQVNVDVLDADGRFLGCVDLLEPGSGLVAEYDGSGHREARRHAQDNAREERLEDAGLVVVRAGAPDLVDREATARRLRSGYVRAVRRTGPRRWSWREARRSPRRSP